MFDILHFFNLTLLTHLPTFFNQIILANCFCFCFFTNFLLILHLSKQDLNLLQIDK